MTGQRCRYAAAALALATGLGLAGCTGGSGTALLSRSSVVPAGSISLVAFRNCDDALAGLRSAAKASVGAYGLAGYGSGSGYAAEGLATKGMPGGVDAAPQAATPPGNTAPAYSATNTAEAGIDEPDLVKTDGHRIVTVSGGVLRVIDTTTGAVTGRLDIGATDGQYRYSTANLLLDGDHALLLAAGNSFMYGGIALPGGVTGSGGGPAISAPDPGIAVPAGPAAPPVTPVAPATAVPPTARATVSVPTTRATTIAPPTARTTAPVPVPVPSPVSGPHLLLVDLAGKPRVLATYAIDGGLVDARQVGATARVVIRSAPRIDFPQPPGDVSDTQRIAANRTVIDRAGTADWLPRFEMTTGGTTQSGHVPCDAVSRPATYTGTNLLTVLTFDLGADTLGTGAPVTIAADGDTVYATGTSLYIASDQRWQTTAFPLQIPARPDDAKPASAPATPATPPPTMIYRFDISHAGPPVYVATGSVPGYLVDQYAMSEWGGNLRVATTTGTSWAEADGRPAGAVTSESAVYVLATAGPVMRQVGHVGGLGQGERIYAVRFLGPVGYVVTFRQTDPLYTVDLSDPARPRVRGAVQLTGYSAYLHPASDTRLIGIGQQADAQGHVGGTQVSLFDVSDLTAPSRVDTFAISGGHSDAEFDPHAFLYWPAMHLVVVPLQTYGTGGVMTPGSPPGSPILAEPRSGALILRIDDSGITEAGFISQPTASLGYAYQASIERSIVIGQTLWTVSGTGVMATDLTNLRQVAWIPYT